MSTSPINAAITATAVFFPPKIRSNSYFYDDLGLDTNEEWILSRTGVKERRVARLEEGESCGTLAAEAAQRCLEKGGITADQVEGVVLGTISGDLGFPATACLVQDRIGAKNAFAFDISGACTGYLHALATATAMVESGRCNRVLAIGAEAMSAILDYEDRATCLLFGDGAGATLVERVEEEHPGRILDITLGSDGSGAKYLYRTGGGALHLPGVEHADYPQVAKVWQDGRAVFRFAVQRMVKVINGILKRNSLTLDDIALVVPHQANIRIIEAACNRLRLPLDKVAIYVDRYANTVAATLPTALNLSAADNRLAKGDLVLLATFGAGLSWGAALLRWGGSAGDAA
jgi:3-oxoacyl-[acyl-carrier-protein] synthase-3